MQNLTGMFGQFKLYVQVPFILSCKYMPLGDPYGLGVSMLVALSVFGSWAREEAFASLGRELRATYWV